MVDLRLCLVAYVAQVLSDIVEAIVGALFISDDFTEPGVVNFFDSALKPFFDLSDRIWRRRGGSHAMQRSGIIQVSLF